MIFWQTIAVAFGMFSAVPLPQPQWGRRNMRYALCAFPAVGLVSGAGILGIALLAAKLEVSAFLRAAILCLWPAAVTGGIHLDGYADTCDAAASCGDMEKRLEIMADPHCGAFAVIRLCSYFILSFALWAQLEATREALLPLALGQVLSRALSGYAVARFPLAKNTGLAHTFASAADQKTAGRILLLEAGACALGMAACGAAGAAMAAGSVLVLLGYKRTAQKQFGGVSGDLAGWFLVRCELFQLIIGVIWQLVSRGA